MCSQWLAFVDESGNDGMDFTQQGASEYYVLAAVALRPSDLPQAAAVFQDTKLAHFKNAREMKSGYVGDKDARRLTVTASLARAEFTLHLRVAHKRLLHGKGFRYASSFIKYLLGDLVSDLLSHYDDPVIQCDQIKTPSFGEDLKRYLYSRYPPDLLRPWSFNFVDSKDNLCVQAADIIAGTGYRCCERSPDAPEQDQLLQLLNKHLSKGSFRPFPPPRTTEAPLDPLGSYDPELEMRAVSDAEAYLSRHLGTKEPTKAALVACIAELLKHNTLQGTPTWVTTRRLAAACEVVRREHVSFRSVRSFVGKLRDEGLLIASRRNPGGYKLPNRMADVVEFLNTQNDKIKPMMRRIQKARNVVYGLSGTDILTDPKFQNLLRLLPPVGTPADNI